MIDFEINKRKQLSIIKIPIWYGSNRRGVELAPDLLFQEIKKSPLALSTDREITIPIPETKDDTQFLHHLEDIVTADIELSKQVQTQLENGSVVLTLGGDHAIGLGSVAGSLQYDNNIGVIWFDAHGDMNTEMTSLTGHIHGMPTAALMGLCSSKLNEVAPIHVNPKNIFWIGVRDLDPGEKELVERLHLNVYSTERIHEVGMNTVLKDVKTKMEQQGIKNIHLSFDVDAFDPQLFPATGVKVQNGLWTEDFETFVNYIPTLPQLIAIDFVEYNPLMDNATMDCKHKSILFIEQLLRVNAL